MVSELSIVTQNDYKVRYLRRVLSNYNIKLNQIYEETFEIQADTCEEVASFSAKNSANKYNKPIIKGDFGFFIEAWNGLPGVYAKDFVKKLGVKKVLEMLKEETNRKAYMIYALAYCEPNKEPVVFTAKVNGLIINELRSSAKFLTDPFIPEGESLTMGEMREQGKEDEFKFFEEAETKLVNWLVKKRKIT